MADSAYRSLRALPVAANCRNVVTGFGSYDSLSIPHLHSVCSLACAGRQPATVIQERVHHPFGVVRLPVLSLLGNGMSAPSEIPRMARQNNRRGFNDLKNLSIVDGSIPGIRGEIPAILWSKMLCPPGKSIPGETLLYDSATRPP
jgi:hypothetical protein